MSDAEIFFIGVCVSMLCVAFVVASFIGLRQAGRSQDDRGVSEPAS
jgi:hypothetical protein